MAYLYVYGQDEIECANIGLVGALFAYDARYELQAGEFGELSFKHPIDEYGKWKALEDGALIRADVPCRLPREFTVTEGGSGESSSVAWVSSVDVYRVSDAATKYQRYVYYASTKANDPTYETEEDRGKKKKDGSPKLTKVQKTKHKKLLKAGTRVYVIADPRPGDDSYRYKVRVGSGKKRVVGYMEKDGLTLIQKDKSVPSTDEIDGLEAENPSYAVQPQLFRIYEVETNAANGGADYLTVRARRLVYDLLGNVSTYRSKVSHTGYYTARHVLSSAVEAHPFSAHSDIADMHIGFDARNLNPIEALIDPEEGVAARWGGEVFSDDYDIYIMHRAGMDRGVTIEYGKNLTGVKCAVDSSNVATAVRPVGETAAGNPLYIAGMVVTDLSTGKVTYEYNWNGSTGKYETLPTGYKFIEDNVSGNGNTIARDIAYDGYAAPKIRVIQVADAKISPADADPDETEVVDKYLARRMLVRAAIAEFAEGCDAPEIALDVDFVLLGDTEEYAQYRHLEPMFIYDTVRVRHPRVKVAVETKLTRIVWDVVAGRMLEAGFGSLGDMMGMIPGWQIAGLSAVKVRSVDMGDEE